MAEPLKIKLTSDSSELRSDIEQDIKVMQKMSDKYKDIEKQLTSRTPEDFQKVLSKAIENSNKKLEEQRKRTEDAIAEFNEQDKYATELTHDEEASEKEKEAAAAKANELLEKAKAEKQKYLELEKKQGEIVEKTTREYNAQTEALGQQANELKANYNILDAIVNKDMKELKKAEFAEDMEKGVKSLGGMFNKLLSGVGSKISNLFNFKKASNQLQSMAGYAGRMALALFGAQTAYTLIAKATRQILNDNEQLSNTISTVWNSLVALIAPVVNTIVSVLATALNYVIAIISYISSLDVLGLMNKTQKKANSASSGGSSNKQSQQYSFDTAETLQKNDSSGGSAGAVTDSYLKQVELSEVLEAYAKKLKAIWKDIQQIGKNLVTRIKEGLDYMNSGQRILQVGKDLLDAFLDDVKQITEATVAWSESINFGPLFNSVATVLEAIEPILSRIGDLGVWIYENAILPIATWATETLIPEILNTIASCLDVVNQVLVAMQEPLQWLWDNVVTPLAETVGQTIIDLLAQIKDIADKLGTWLTDHPEFVEMVTTVGELVLAIGALAAGLLLVWDGVSQVITIFSELSAFLATPVGAIVAVIAICVALIAIFGDIDVAIEAMQEIMQGLIDFIVGIFTGDWDRAWTGVKEIFEGIWKLIVEIIDAALNAIQAGFEALGFDIDLVIQGVRDVLDGIVEFISGVFSGDWEQAWTGVKKIFDGVLEAILGLAELQIQLVLGIFEKLGFDVDGIFEGIKQTFDGVLKFVKDVFSGDWEAAWEDIKDIFKGIWNTIVSLLESALNFIVDGINKISFSVPDWVPFVGGKSVSFNLSRIELPKLAKGAVIPPNQEFLAILGDQTRGRNIETPEGLLREIVQEESGSQEINIVANGDMSQLIKLLRFKLQEEDKRVGTSLIVGG